MHGLGFEADISEESWSNWNYADKGFDYESIPHYSANLLFEFVPEDNELSEKYDEVPSRNFDDVPDHVLADRPSEELLNLVNDGVSADDASRVVDLLEDHEGDYYDELSDWLEYWCLEVGVDVNLVDEEYNY